MTGGPGCSSSSRSSPRMGPTASTTISPSPSTNTAGTPCEPHLRRPAHRHGFLLQHRLRRRRPRRATRRGGHAPVPHGFADAHPELADNDFYITRKISRTYVPAVSYRVFREQAEGWRPVLPLRGLAIGNGLTMPEIQYGAYADYALGVDLVPELAAKAARMAYPKCARMIRECGGGTADPDGPGPESDRDARLCTEAVDFCQRIPGELLFAAGDVNVYGVRKPCTIRACATTGSGSRSFSTCTLHAHRARRGDRA